MKPTRHFVVLVLLILVYVPALTQWVQTTGPRGGRITALTSVGDTIYCGINLHGVYRSTNDGEDWMAANSGLPDPEGQGSVFALAQTRGAVLVGTLNGVYRTTNAGASWSRGESSPVAVLAFAVKESILFAGTQGAGLHQSRDHGASWAAVTTGFQGYFLSLAFTGNALLVGTDGGGMYRSTDLGTTWSQAGSGFPANGYVSVIHATPWGAFAAAGGQLFRTTDLGASWSYSGYGLPSPTLVKALASYGDTVFAGTAPIDSGSTWFLGGLYRSIDRGVHWTAVGGQMRSSTVEALLADGRKVFAGGIGGLLASTDRGSSWRQQSAGMPVQTTNALAFSGSTLFAGTAGGGVSVTTDGGGAWTPSNAGILYGNATAFAGHAGYMFAGVGTGGGGATVVRSSDSGASWEELRPGLSMYVYTLASHGGRLYAGTNGGVFASADTGRTWTSLGSLGVFVYSLAFLGERIFAGTISRLFYSTDQGSNWVAAYNTGLPDDVSVALAVVGDRVFVGGSYHGVYASTDSGGSWFRASTGLADTSVNCLMIHQNRLVAGTGRGVFASADTARTWFNIAAGLSPQGVLCLAARDTMIYAGLRGGGVWSRPISQLITWAREHSAASVPAACRLHQNYPNPFNPGTSIRYTLPQRTTVTLSVYNPLGQRIAMLVQGEEGPGQHEVRFDGSGLPSGIYFYRMVAGIFAETKRMLLVK